MKLAIISDIHSNLAALEAVLQRIEELKADAIYCLGDLVGYGPYPNECVDLVRTKCSVVIKGNHDSGLVGETPVEYFNQYGRSAIEWTKRKISGPNLEYLASLPFSYVDHNCTFVHGSPHQPEQWTYLINWAQAAENFRAFSTMLCFVGHTHVPVVISEDSKVNSFDPGKRHIINVGSIGQPRDGDPDAAFGVLETEPLSYRLVRVSYDISKTASAIQEAGLPYFLARRLFQGV